MSAPGADSFGGTEGVDGNAMGIPDAAPEDWSAPGYQGDREPDRHESSHPDLGAIYQRMDQLGAQNQALVDAFQYAAAAGDEDDGYDEDGYELTPEEADALAGLTDAEIDALAREGEDALGYENGEPLDVFDMIDQSVQARVSEAEARRGAETAIEDREEAFDDLREAMPLLQNEQAARRIVQRAQDLAHGWNPEIVNSPAFVHLIELVALASVAEQATDQQRAAAQQPQIMLESANGGAGLSHAPAASQPDWGARVVAAAQRLRPQI